MVKYELKSLLRRGQDHQQKENQAAIRAAFRKIIISLRLMASKVPSKVLLVRGAASHGHERHVGWRKMLCFGR